MDYRGGRIVFVFIFRNVDSLVEHIYIRKFLIVHQKMSVGIMLQFLHIIDAENIAILRKAVALGVCFAQGYVRQFIISLHITTQKYLDFRLCPHQVDGTDAGLVASLHAYIQWLDTPHRDGMLAGIGCKEKLIHICLAEIIGILHAIDIGIDHHLTIKHPVVQIQSVY